MPSEAIAPDQIGEAAQAIEELTAEFGLKVFLMALLRSSVSGDLPHDPEKTRRVTQFILREIIFSPTPQLEAEIMAIGAGVLDEDGIMTRIAEKHRITRAAVSKRVVAFCDEWHLDPSAPMKSKAARARYTARNQPKL